ncbi:hypothetical protein XENOCAPTIV_029213 [Xenoophorus captivus]|uniref:Uncharacterized protein n=1 Tax=Xenoophorus captivus TaxID=1517983 RepID=A0ABV0RXV2_9TELE
MCVGELNFCFCASRDTLYAPHSCDGQTAPFGIGEARNDSDNLLDSNNNNDPHHSIIVGQRHVVRTATLNTVTFITIITIIENRKHPSCSNLFPLRLHELALTQNSSFRKSTDIMSSSSLML